MNGASAVARIGSVRAITTDGRGLTPEEWAEITLEKLISISDQVPEPVRDQLYAYRDRVRLLLVAAMRNAIKSDRTNIINFLNAAGHPELATSARTI